MIVDGVMLGYATELDLLDIRLHELADVVDRFVVVEACETFTGKRKPLHLYHERGRFAAFADRLQCVTLHKLPGGDAWAREAYQRNAILTGCADLADDDAVLIGDCDEIPRAEAVAHAAHDVHAAGQIAFLQRLSAFYVNVECFTADWKGTQMVTAGEARRLTPQGVRDRRNSAPYVIAPGGWHFGNIVGRQGVEALQTKIVSFSHTEVATPEILDAAHLRECVALGKDVSGRTDILFRVEAHERDLPRYLLAHQADMGHLFYPGTL